MSANPVPRRTQVQGVVIDPIRAGPGGKVYSNEDWRTEELDHKDLTEGTWYDLLVPRCLGIPLRFKGYKNANEYGNWFVRIVSIDVDTTDTAQEVVRRGGFSRIGEEGNCFGGIILVRDNGRDLKFEDVQVLILHVDTLNQAFDLNDFASAVGKRIDGRSTDAFRKLQESWKKDGNKMALRNCWHRLGDEMLNGDHKQVWSELECPVVSDDGNKNAISQGVGKSAKSSKRSRCIPQ